MNPSIPHTTHPQVRLLVQLFQAAGLRHAVLSPGSRNAPLAEEFAASPLQCFSVVDERSAAFFALGLSKEEDLPAVAVCTSGSAVLNYYPAVAEAYYSRIPLIVVSADRPADWIDQAIGQTIRQDRVLASHTVYNTTLHEGDDPQTAWYNRREISAAIQAARRESAPVHINVPLSEPLYQTIDLPEGEPAPILTREPVTATTLSPESREEILHLWQESRRKMILVGASRRSETLEKHLRQLARESDTVVLCETTSNLHGEDFFEHIDRIVLPLSPDTASALYPDLLITCGGMVVSKKIKTFLKAASPRYHLHVSPYTWPDTYMSLTHRIPMSGEAFFPLLCGAESTDEGYLRTWKQLDQKQELAHREYCQRAPYSDFKVWELLSRALPPHTHLEVANSAAIRYNQLFPLPQSVTVSCNRGTSGIDGSTSTAVGAAVALSPRPVTLVSGDLAFLYDNNALWNDHIPAEMRIVVINNGGGGIFRILNGARTSPICSRYLQAAHRKSVEPLARLHNWEYRAADDTESLREALRDFWEPSSHPRMLEVFTREEDNDEVLRGYFSYLSE